MCEPDRVTWVLDLDGVVWLGDQVIDGAPQAVRALRDLGHRVLFVTNNSSSPMAEVEGRLAARGIPASGDVVTSAISAAGLVEPGDRVLVCAGEGVREALAERGAVAVDEGPADAVMVGFHRDFDWDRMRVAATAVRNGARLVGTNADPTYPTPEGLVPGGGAILAGVAAAAGVEPEIAGKPHGPMVEVVGRAVPDDAVDIVVGDRPDTDGSFARALGVDFGLVLSGATRAADGPFDPTPEIVADDLATLVAARCGVEVAA